jgi:hypothetical protein
VDARDLGSYISGCAIEEYFKQQRSKTAKKLACHEDTIHYVCLQPDLDQESRFKMLEKSGIFILKNYMTLHYIPSKFCSDVINTISEHLIFVVLVLCLILLQSVKE